MLSDKKTTPKKVKDKKTPGKKPWGDDQKIEAVQTYVALGGNFYQTCKALSVPECTLKRWRKTQWWADAYEEIRQQDNVELSHKLKNIVARSLALVEDRLERGDFFYDQKTGQVVRKEVSLRDAHEVMKSSFQMKESIEKPPVAALEESSVNDKLAQLAKQFEQFAVTQKAKPAINVTDVVFIENKDDDNAN